MKKIAVLTLSLALLFSALVFAGGSREKDSMMSGDQAMNSDNGMASDSDTMMSDDSMSSDDSMMSDDSMSSDGEMKDDNGAMMSSMATKIDFTTIDDAMMYAESGPTVLLFVDDSSDSKMAVQTVNDNFADISPNVTILTVPFSNTSLRNKYGVTAAGTFVIIGTDGMKVSSWTGGDIAEFNHMIMMDEGAM